METFELVKRVCEYAKRIHEPLKMVGNVTDPILLGWCDANFDINSAECRLGYIVQLIDLKELTIGKGVVIAPHHNVVAWRSMRPGRAVGSSSVAELLALREVIKVMPHYSSVVHKLWGRHPKEYYFTDNQSVIDWTHSGWIKSDPRWQGVLKQVLSDMSEPDRQASLHWVGTHEQRADKLTKFVAAE